MDRRFSVPYGCIRLWVTVSLYDCRSSGKGLPEFPRQKDYHHPVPEAYYLSRCHALLQQRALCPDSRPMRVSA
jgi:hypothetical protein